MCPTVGENGNWCSLYGKKYGSFCRAGEGRMGLWKVKMSQILFWLRLSCFSLINTPWIIVSLQLIFRILKKLILMIFVNVLIAFVEVQVFESLTPPCWVSQAKFFNIVIQYVFVTSPYSTLPLTFFCFKHFHNSRRLFLNQLNAYT